MVITVTGLGLPGATLCLAGSYEPAVELLVLQRVQGGSSMHASTSSSTDSGWRFQPLCRLRGDALSAALSADAAAELSAAGAQIPMVATDVGGINEIFGPYRNRLIRPDDVELLATRMGEMLATDEEILLRQAQDLAAFVQSRFSISIMADSVIAGYREAETHRAAAHAGVHSYPLPS